MPKADPQQDDQHRTEAARLAAYWRTLREFVDYGNQTDWPDSYRKRYERALAVQRSLTSLLRQVEAGELASSRGYQPTWALWVASIERELGPSEPRLAESRTTDTTEAILDRVRHNLHRYDHNQTAVGPVLTQAELRQLQTALINDLRLLAERRPQEGTT